MKRPSPEKVSPSASNPREALKESDRKASEEQPGRFKEEGSDDKIVEISPSGPDKRPIRGLDPR